MPATTENRPVGPSTYAGLFLVALATLMYEILLTRIFSVIMFYHFAFMAISVAMFGMTVGSIVVYLRPQQFGPEKVLDQLVRNTLGFALTVLLSVIVFVNYQARPDQPFSLAQAVLLISISLPFVFSGICVCLALTRVGGSVGKMYAADLGGAALGCLFLMATLKFTDGLTAVFVVAWIALIAAMCFAANTAWARFRDTFALLACAGAGLIVLNTVLSEKQLSPLHLNAVKCPPEVRRLWEKWNSFSRICVVGSPRDLEERFPASGPAQLNLTMDSGASTDLTAFDGQLERYQYLTRLIPSLAHHFRNNASVLVIGVGGGRDVLSALACGQKSVLGVEINENILYALNRRYGDFTGHLDRNPKVRFANDEARSYITRSRERFDIIQASLIDTWAATTAGAFTLTENSLYTVEAWTTFLDHLNPHGILTFTRWYFRDRPGEVYRLTSLASTSLLARGVKEPRGHIIIVRSLEAGSPEGLATMLLSPDPFTPQDLQLLEKIVPEMGFEVVLSPNFAIDDTFARLASGQDLEAFARQYPLNIAPPTDDSPFFFNMLRLRDFFQRPLWDQGVVSFNLKAVYTLCSLLLIMTVLTTLCIVVPLALTGRKQNLRGTFPLFVFFISIGLGFMLIEISQMQRFTVFLGHPSYGLTVLLFSLLISSGLGSLSTMTAAKASRWMLLLLFVLGLFGLLTPTLLLYFRSSTTWIRILVATGVLFPIGFVMGMAFPLGMNEATRRRPEIAPWLWGLNGATSVLASILAIAISMAGGISATFWVGFLCYLAAATAFVAGSRAAPPVS